MKSRSRQTSRTELVVPAVVLALVLCGTWLAPRWGDHAVPAQVVLGVVGCGVIGLRAARASLAELGLRVVNLPAASLVFGLVTFAAVAPLAVRKSSMVPPFPLRELPSYFLWALFQQFVAVGGFWLPFRRYVGLPARHHGSFRSEIALAGASAFVFAVAHAPNVGLMALVGLAEWIWLFLFARWPWRNLYTMSLAHAAAALVVAHHLVPSPWLPSMRVGLDYFCS